MHPAWSVRGSLFIDIYMIKVVFVFIPLHSKSLEVQQKFCRVNISSVATSLNPPWIAKLVQILDGNPLAGP